MGCQLLSDNLQHVVHYAEHVVVDDMPKHKSPSVPAVDRALTVIECLAESKGGFTVSDISRTLGLPKSSLHVILSTLERRGYLQKNIYTNKYHFGLKLVSLSRTAFNGLGLREEAKPFLQALAKKTGLTVHLAVLERNEAVIIEKVETPGLIKVATWIGRRLDANCTAAGKALIAYLPEEELERQTLGKGLAKHNHKTICSIGRIKEEISKVRKLGYAFDNEEDEIGLRCLGAPIFGSSEEAVAAISVSGTSAQISLARVPKLAEVVKKTAVSLSQHLGSVSFVDNERMIH